MFNINTYFSLGLFHFQRLLDIFYKYIPMGGGVKIEMMECSLNATEVLLKCYLHANNCTLVVLD